MFKSEGELAVAIAQDRYFEIDGWICKFNPLGEEGCLSPFICKQPDTGKWFAMNTRWSKYATAKEVFPDLDAIKSCVVNYLSGKEGINDKTAKKIFAMDSDSFWVLVGGKLTRGFNPRARLDTCAEVSDLRIEKHGDIFLVI